MTDYIISDDAWNSRMVKILRIMANHDYLDDVQETILSKKKLGDEDESSRKKYWKEIIKIVEENTPKTEEEEEEEEEEGGYQTARDCSGCTGYSECWNCDGCSECCECSDCEGCGNRFLGVEQIFDCDVCGDMKCSDCWGAPQSGSICGDCAEEHENNPSS